MQSKNMYLSILIIIVALSIGEYLLRRHIQEPMGDTTTTSNTNSANEKNVTFVCDNNAYIGVTFYLPEDKKIDVILSDGSTFSLDHVVSADGARYANADESIVLWNKGNDVTLTENNVPVYSGCTLSSDNSAN